LKKCHKYALNELVMAMLQVSEASKLSLVFT
jgi:hypothetical protein